MLLECGAERAAWVQWALPTDAGADRSAAQPSQGCLLLSRKEWLHVIRFDDPAAAVVAPPPSSSDS